jgi:phytoene synthase
MVDKRLEASKEIHRRTGKTFYYATRLLPKRVREATYALYGFFRVADEVVDNNDGLPPAEQRRRLEAIREAALTGDTDDPVLAAFADTRERYDIPAAEVETFIDAMLTDIETDRYATYADLEAYMRGSASAVGVMMTAVMDPTEREAALPHAVKLGEAFQLTNFVRDVGEDIRERGRIYLPQDTLAAHGASEGSIERGEATLAVRDAIAAELRRAEGLYREGVAGIKYLPVDCQLPVLTAAVLYAGHHDLIRERDYDTVTATPSLSAWQKTALVARTRWHWTWSKDPETVFEKVGVIPTTHPTPSRGERGDAVPAR